MIVADRPIDVPNLSLFEAVFGSTGAGHASRGEIIDFAAGTRLGRDDLIAAIVSLAGALNERGVRPGSVVALFAPNSPAFVIAFHAILRAGAAATTVNLLSTKADVAKQLSGSGASIILTSPDLLPIAREAAAVAGLAPDALVLLEPREDLGAYSAITDLCGLGLTPQYPHPSSEALAVLPYSSGTTGHPKGVMLTHHNLVANLGQVRDMIRVTSEHRFIAVLPFFHIYGMTMLMSVPLQASATLVTLERFDLGIFLEVIEVQKITHAFIAPPIALALAKNATVASRNLSSLQLILSGAAPLDKALGLAVESRTGAKVIQGYGMSELSPVSHLMPEDGGLSRFGRIASHGSIGWPVAGTQNKIVEPDSGREIDRPTSGMSMVGELWVRGPNVMQGYLGDPVATEETIDNEGFLHTGDLVQIDADGCIHVTDRLKELIKYKGYQVAPAELEAVLLTHDAIVDAAVVGVRDEDGEEMPKAFVVLLEGRIVSAEEIVAYVSERVAPYKKVRAVAFVQTLPKSPSGKILRRLLRS